VTRRWLSVADIRAELHIGGRHQQEGTMTEEKKKPQEDEVSDEQLKDVAGGIIDIPSQKKKIAEPLNKSMEREGTIET
jgi:hypothetical protein